MASEPRKMVTVVFVLTVLFAQVSSESCYVHQCLSCGAERSTFPGSPTECHPSNWVSAEWVHNIGHPPPFTNTKIPIEYRCLKMVATPDNKAFGNTIDVIKGCVPKAQVDSVCISLEAVERARGHSDARCYICRGNNCNPGTVLHANLLPYINILTTLFYILR